MERKKRENVQMFVHNETKNNNIRDVIKEINKELID